MRRGESEGIPPEMPITGPIPRAFKGPATRQANRRRLAPIKPGPASAAIGALVIQSNTPQRTTIKTHSKISRFILWYAPSLYFLDDNPAALHMVDPYLHSLLDVAAIGHYVQPYPVKVRDPNWAEYRARLALPADKHAHVP